jgi:hypothetical protein
VLWGGIKWCTPFNFASLDALKAGPRDPKSRLLDATGEVCEAPDYWMHSRQQACPARCAVWNFVFHANERSCALAWLGCCWCL